MDFDVVILNEVNLIIDEVIVYMMYGYLVGVNMGLDYLLVNVEVYNVKLVFFGYMY